MYTFLWIDLSIHVFWFLVGLVICTVVMVLIGRATGMLLLALFLYNVTVWSPWPAWLPDLFLLAVLIALAGIILGLFTGQGAGMAMGGAVTALIVAIWLMSSHALGLTATAVTDSGNPGTSGLNSQFETELADERSHRISNDNDVRQDFDRLSARYNHQIHRLNRLAHRLGDHDSRLTELKRRVSTLEGLVEEDQRNDANRITGYSRTGGR